MPSAVLDAPRTALAPAQPARSAQVAARRLPVTVVAAAALAVVEALGLLAFGLAGLDGLFGSGTRPAGSLIAVTLMLLAGWVVACAGGGASLLDGAGRRLLVAVSLLEVVALLALGVAGVVAGLESVVVGPAGVLPVPALALLALAVPTGKLLLAGSPSAVAWVASGGRPAAPRPVRVVEHRVLRGVTVACIGLALAGVAVLGAPAEPSSSPSTVAVTDGR